MDLNKIANVSVIVAAAVVIGLAAKERLGSSKAHQSQAPAVRQLIGKPLPMADKLAIGKAATALLFVSKSCHFCADSMPFYQRLSASRRPREVSLVAAVPQGRDNRDEGVTFFAEHGVAVDAVIPLRFTELGVSGTPTIVLLDAEGRVKAVWTGLLSSDKQAEVLSQISALGSGHPVG